MSYSFQPLSDEELDAIDILPEGVYNFEVVKATHKISKAGNSMAEIQLGVWNNANKLCTVFDYLIFSTVPLNIRKVKHFCDSVGLIEEYKKGSLPDELSGYSGKVVVGIQDERPNPNGGFYPRKNVVVDYAKADKNVAKNDSVAGTEELFDDALPF